ncbi:hypothetical protein K437DRAFT_159696 [Tilletiaria anomala UBC 951]|uniref:Prefoldin alpha-like protein n=1 Tax=Tilletiaria anomala (strain ATCC 24038 / CBS 436.72 / UBC 951) TaxID=1037660 RepID=A0A066VQR5_TILAU|nr:uncharacterized protein K437DRAFT_159696 [Tilletiaria anomala UBC 951]KDN42618.1 hypothetical protein K437DRAFT_159696 [Tilletiaria anomala UBC 951]
MIGEEGVDDRPVTSAEIQKARSFLVERLLPDLDQTKQKHDLVRSDIAGYERLLVHLRELEERARRGVVHVDSHIDSDDGMTLPAKYSTTANPIVHLGLGNLYLELPAQEARAFVSSRLKLLSKRLGREQENIAKIEAVVHLSSTTLVKLEALHRGETKTILDEN